MTQNSTSVQPPKTLRVALQSALAAALFLGFPAGLSLWLFLFREANPSAAVDLFITLLQANGVNKILVLMLCSLGWSFSLGRISGYRAWWKIGLATALGLIAAWFSPLSNMDGWLPFTAADRTPIPLLYAVTMCGIVFSATLCVGLAYGILLRNIRAALTVGLATSLISTLALLLTIFIFDQFGIYVGSAVPLAMSKVTTMSLLVSAIVGGAVLGVGFTRGHLNNVTLSGSEGGLYCQNRDSSVADPAPSE